jgi:hypothetical protein
VVLGLAVAATIGVWVAADHGDDSTSHQGCVTVIMASSTGGARLHECGDTARALCRSAYATNDKLALLTRPQCQLAGLAGQDTSAR